MPSQNRLLLINDFVNSCIGMESCFNILKNGDRAVSSASAINGGVRNWLGKIHAVLPRRADTDGIMKSETEGFVNVFTTLSIIEEILLKVVTEGEQRATSSVSSCVFAVRTGDTLSQGRCQKNTFSDLVTWTGGAYVPLVTWRAVRARIAARVLKAIAICERSMRKTETSWILKRGNAGVLYMVGRGVIAYLSTFLVPPWTSVLTKTASKMYFHSTLTNGRHEV